MLKNGTFLHTLLNVTGGDKKAKARRNCGKAWYLGEIEKVLENSFDGVPNGMTIAQYFCISYPALSI
jgi:hypothetical protein